VNAILVAVYIVSVVFFWLLVYRAVVGFFRINPYNPSVQFLLRITEPLVRPFRRSIKRPNPRLDPAVFPPMIIFLLIIILLGIQLWWGK
jgi:uncharacterized protein YggT (Ycf19 family)